MPTVTCSDYCCLRHFTYPRRSIMDTRISKTRIATPAAKAGPKSPNIAKKPNWYLRIGIALFIMAIVGYWWLRPDPQIAKVRDMRKELMAAGQTMSADERKSKFEALRAEEEKLPKEARKDLRKEMGQAMQSKRDAEAVAYLKMSQ